MLTLYTDLICLLGGFDNEIRGCLEKELLNKGIKIYPKTKIKKVSKNSKLEIELDLSLIHI